ncbi:MAG: hypothetical protein C4342_02565 [Armatimonadota bacterium]
MDIKQFYEELDAVAERLKALIDVLDEKPKLLTLMQQEKLEGACMDIDSVLDELDEFVDED